MDSDTVRPAVESILSHADRRSAAVCLSVSSSATPWNAKSRRTPCVIQRLSRSVVEVLQRVLLVFVLIEAGRKIGCWKFRYVRCYLLGERACAEPQPPAESVSDITWTAVALNLRSERIENGRESLPSSLERSLTAVNFFWRNGTFYAPFIGLLFLVHRSISAGSKLKRSERIVRENCICFSAQLLEGVR